MTVQKPLDSEHDSAKSCLTLNMIVPWSLANNPVYFYAGVYSSDRAAIYMLVQRLLDSEHDVAWEQSSNDTLEL